MLEMQDKLEIDCKTLYHLLSQPEKTKTAKFYFIPKIHKKRVRGRPIISSNCCPTEKISAFVDEHNKS